MNKAKELASGSWAYTLTLVEILGKTMSPLMSTLALRE